jgi:hypothetical protein
LSPTQLESCSANEESLTRFSSFFEADFDWSFFGAVRQVTLLHVEFLVSIPLLAGLTTAWLDKS